jgi:hypothetical protein
MNLPWLQIEQSTFERASMLAKLLKISKNEALGAILELWRTAIAMADPRTKEPGLLVSENPSELLLDLTGIANANVTRSQIGDAFEFVGLVEIRANGLRVRGVSRYLEAELKKEQKASQSAERSRKYREQLKNSRDTANANVTRSRTHKNAPREEKRREENIYSSQPKKASVDEVSCRPKTKGWSKLVAWLDSISLAAIGRTHDWSQQELQALRKLVEHHEFKNHGRRGAIGELWCYALTNESPYAVTAFTIADLRSKFEKLRQTKSVSDSIQALKDSGKIPPEPDWGETAKKADVPPAPISTPTTPPIVNDGFDHKDPPKRQPGPLEAIFGGMS